MIEVYRVDLTKEKLEAMPPKERQLLLLLGHAANEINVLQKLIKMTTPGNSGLAFVSHAETGQSFILVRVLIGKLHEAWELFKNRFQSESDINSKYVPKLSTEAANATDSLKKYFGKNKALTDIRKCLSFHYSDKKNLIEKSFQEISGDDKLKFYLSEKPENSFYHASERVVLGSIIGLTMTEQGDGESHIDYCGRAIGDILDQTIDVSRQIMVLFEQCITEIFSEYFPDVDCGNPIGAFSPPSLSSIHIPFFFDPDATR